MGSCGLRNSTKLSCGKRYLLPSTKLGRPGGIYSDMPKIVAKPWYCQGHGTVPWYCPEAYRISTRSILRKILLSVKEVTGTKERCSLHGETGAMIEGDTCPYFGLENGNTQTEGLCCRIAASDWSIMLSHSFSSSSLNSPETGRIFTHSTILRTFAVLNLNSATP
jgi:hypothetical protein